MRLQTYLLLCLALGIYALPRGGGDHGGGGQGGGGRGGWGRGSRQTQYSSFSKPSRPIGSYTGVDGKKYGYRTAGHGTNWGTSFSGGTGVYNKKKKGLSKKALGLGVGAGFVGGAALGMAGTMATYSVYHRYLLLLVYC